MAKFKLVGRIILKFKVQILSGLAIGGSNENISIGGVDRPVIRDPFNNQPYIPGSSLRGKIRSLLEKYGGYEQNTDIGSGVTIHSCGPTRNDTQREQAQKVYLESKVCQIFGITGEKFSKPTRLIVRDIPMDEDSATRLESLRTDLPYTEVKTEVSIDRVTSKAHPRQIERVPAGVVFSDAEMVYSLYDIDGSGINPDLDNFQLVLIGLQLLEDDYLGGLGSRGSGKVALKNISVQVKSSESYDQPSVSETYDTLPKLLEAFDGLKNNIKTALQPEES